MLFHLPYLVCWNTQKHSQGHGKHLEHLFFFPLLKIFIHTDKLKELYHTNQCFTNLMIVNICLSCLSLLDVYAYFVKLFKSCRHFATKCFSLHLQRTFSEDILLHVNNTIITSPIKKSDPMILYHLVFNPYSNFSNCSKNVYQLFSFSQTRITRLRVFSVF